METIHPHCAGLDIHKDNVVACVRHVAPSGRARSEVRTFSTLTAGLLELADWLVQQGVSHAAMESTGVYWKPVYHILEGTCELLLVNAEHVKKVPGRKTDVKDSEWLAQLLQCGLLRPSFIPPASIRALRDLTRQRIQLVGEKTRVANRLQKVLEDTNVKLASVATDILGKSGRAILNALVEGETDAARLAELALGRLRDKIPRLREALRGKVTEHHRFLLRLLLQQVSFVEGQLSQLEGRITEALGSLEGKVQQLMEVPGISRTVAEVVLAEVGPDLTAFPSEAHVASWLGLCPGNDQSAGRRRSGTTGKGNRWLKATLVQAAWAASRSKGTYLRARFHRLAARRGRKRALVAVAHTLVGLIYQILKHGKPYRELGEDYFDRTQAERLTRRLIHRLERLGHQVTIQPVPKTV